MTKTAEWVPYTGDYEKQFYDIRLRDKRELPRCWPNAGTFHAEDGAYVKGEYVTHIRLSEKFY